MLTQYDKLFASLAVLIIGILNQKFGWSLSTDPTVVAGVIGAVMAIVTWAVPNKVTTAQTAAAAAPSSKSGV